MRLFVAFEMPPSLRQELGRRGAAVRRSLPKASWVRDNGMHLTLKFLGDTDPVLVDALVPALREAFAPAAPLRLRVAGLGAFPPASKARVVWCGLEALDGDLAAVQAAVAGAVERVAGLEPERRPFHPHLTLARCRTPWARDAVERLAALFGPLPEEVFAVDHGVLFESTLHPEGAAYRAVETFPLEGRS